MCDIAGIFSPAYRSHVPYSALGHRGPDWEGIWMGPLDQVWLGHRRLSILDLSTPGHHPMSCLDGRYRIVFNREIYNFTELKKLAYDFQSWQKASNGNQAWSLLAPVHFVLWQKRLRSRAAREALG